VVLEPERVGQRVHRKGVLGGALGPEERHLCAQREDEVVVRNRLETLESDLLRLQVHRGDGSRVDHGVVLVLHQIAERVPDRRRLEEARRELVEQRLEGVVVVPVDEHDVDVGAAEPAGGADAGEASSEHEDART
jgi:hypothetical protein